MKKKLVYISNAAVPHQVKLCYALQQFFDAQFWFYELLGNRPAFWSIHLGEKCKLVNDVFFQKSGRYVSFSLIKQLRDFDPDILILGGFSIPANFFAYQWARLNRKKTVIFTERSRDKYGNLRKKGLAWRILKYLYRNVDIVMVSAEDILPQFRDDFGFGDKVVISQYASDIDEYLTHQCRVEKPQYNYLFPNRLTEIYNPLGAISIFCKIQKKYPGSYLYMNAAGELRKDCEKLIAYLQLDNSIIFLDDIANWSELHLVYKNCDIMLLPAHFSNGNFTIIEAMASGMGIVISEKILGVGKLIEDGINGFNCKNHESEYVGAIEKYIANPKLFEEHKRLNKQKVQSLSVKATAKLFKDILSQVDVS